MNVKDHVKHMCTFTVLFMQSNREFYLDSSYKRVSTDKIIYSTNKSVGDMVNNPVANNILSNSSPWNYANHSPNQLQKKKKKKKKKKLESMSKIK